MLLFAWEADSRLAKYLRGRARHYLPVRGSIMNDDLYLLPERFKKLGF